jgi:hypothetical protein
VDRAGKIRYKHVGKVPVDMPPNDNLLKTIRDMKPD